MELELSVEELCGQLLVGGFAATELSPSFAEALARGHRAGAILFRRNLASLEQLLELNRALAAAAPVASPPFIALDEEGGRVTRLPPPFVTLPAMRLFGAVDDVELTARAAEAIGRQLAAAGFNLDFAPVMDVDTNPENPVIGDRAFGRDARTVMKHGVAFVRGLQGQRVLACAKHFPGHGDTELDSHLALPTVRHALERLRQVEIPPFRAASGAGVAAMMTAHVVYPALEPDVPATFSRAVCASLLRNEIGFEGVLFSDDLEMGAVANHRSVAEAAVEAVWAGCDVVLVCKSEEAQARAHEALVDRARHDPRFFDRCREAAERSLRLRRLCPPRIDAEAARIVQSSDAGEIVAAIERRAAEGPPSGSRLRGGTS